MHNCAVCGYRQDRDIAAAEVMLYWAKGEITSRLGFCRDGSVANPNGNLTELGTSFVDADVTSSTSRTRKQAGSMKQLGRAKRQKSKSTGLVSQTQTSTK